MSSKLYNDLSPYIKEIWTWNDVEPESLPWILPSYEIELVFHLTSPPWVYPLTGEPILMSQIHWVGPQNKRWKIVSTGRLTLISIRFHAGAPYEIFKVSSSEILNCFPTIEQSSFNPFLKLASFFSGKKMISKEDRQLFETKLGEILYDYKAKITPIDTNLKLAFLELTNSNISIYDIERKTGISRKQLERGMKKVYGMTPGELSKIHRILSLIRNPNHYKSENFEARLTDVAYENGYTDQSHLIRDFKSVTGYLPKEWFKSYEKMSYFYNS